MRGSQMLCDYHAAAIEDPATGPYFVYDRRPRSPGHINTCRHHDCPAHLRARAAGPPRSAPAPAHPLGRRPAWGVVATRLPAPGARLGESKRYVSLLGLPFGVLTFIHRFRSVIDGVIPRPESRCVAPQAARARRAHRGLSLIHTLCSHSHTEYRRAISRATVSYRVIMRTYEVEIGAPARNR